MNATVATTVFSGVAVVWLLVTEARDGRWRRPAKMAASSGFIAVAIAAGALGSGFGRLVVAGLALSWVGDLLLTLPAPMAFLGGLAAFLCGHVAYIAAFVVRGVGMAVVAIAAAIVALTAALVWRWLSPHVSGVMRPAVVAYVIVISIMVIAAAGTTARHGDARVLLGAAAFFLSDLAVARERFVTPGFANRAWGLPLYYLGQVLLALAAGATG
ncbi:MAG: hypothetical protein A2Z12_05110 [Actinobacteria bacterium RBG_16_68_21]|nr:MAG: hypothetical protein A2Z12_05110 [Actinobacteria bacterium RBG_16_68_21]